MRHLEPLINANGLERPEALRLNALDGLTNVPYKENWI
jgi:hypothetical protein